MSRNSEADFLNLTIGSGSTDEHAKGIVESEYGVGVVQQRDSDGTP